MKKVLLVEDTAFLAENVSDILQNFGLEVVTVSNGAEGLQILDSAEPDIIITDVLMPLMDGLEFIKAVRNKPKYTAVPIIIFSAKATAHDIELGKRAGADLYLVKPCSAEELIEAITKLINL